MYKNNQKYHFSKELTEFCIEYMNDVPMGIKQKWKDKLFSETSFLNDSDAKIKQRAFHVANNIPYLIKCAHPKCNCNTTWSKIKGKYNLFCDTTCRNSIQINNGIDRFFITHKNAINYNVLYNDYLVAETNRFKFAEFLEKIFKLTDFLDDKNPSIFQRMYHVINNIFETVKCHYKYCNNDVNYPATRIPFHYRTYCSKECADSCDDKVEKMRNSCLEKYGNKHYFKSGAFTETMLDRYGVFSYEQIGKKLEDVVFINSENFTDKIIIKYENVSNICENSDYVFHTVTDKIIRVNNMSRIETIISKLLDNMKIKYSFRKIIQGVEFDFVLEDYNIGIETNGLFYHTVNNRKENIHQNKSIHAWRNKILLIHLTERDIYYKIPQIVSMIRKLTNSIKPVKILDSYQIEQIDLDIIRKFSDENAIHTRYNDFENFINLGLFYHNDLKVVYSLKFTDENNLLILNNIEHRYCNISNNIELLTDYIMLNYSYNHLKAYVDFSKDYGFKYKNNDFVLKNRTSTNLIYFHENNLSIISESDTRFKYEDCGMLVYYY